jgi:hypothetical protein
MHENKIFFLFFLCNFFVSIFQRKSSILITDLYLYSIKIQTNIKKNDRKICRKITNFERIFGKKLFGLGRHWSDPVNSGELSTIYIFMLIHSPLFMQNNGEGRNVEEE